MTFGPFSEAQADQIEAVLKARGLTAVRTHSEERTQEWRQREAARPPSQYREFPEILQTIYLEIGEADVASLGNALEKFGIISVGDGEMELGGDEDYFCPKPSCDVTSTSPMLCPKHRIPLVTFSAKVALARDRLDKTSVIQRLLVIFLILICVCAAAVWLGDMMKW